MGLSVSRNESKLLSHRSILHGLTSRRNRTRPSAWTLSRAGSASVHMRRVLLASLVSATVLTSFVTWPAHSATILRRAVGRDPNDRDGTCCESGAWDMDIRSSHRTVILDRRDRRRLSVSFRSWEAQPGLTYWTVRVHLDTRGGPRPDASMKLSDDGLGQRRCSFRFRDGPIREGTLSIRADGPIDRARCRVPRSWAHPNKNIRWWLRVLLRRQNGDRAPDRGWYP